MSALLESAALKAVQDSYGRLVTSMRISVTQRCNLDCPYCHREGQSPSGLEMSPQEIGKIAGIGARLGVRSVKITGGEPLLREDIMEIIGGIPVRDVSLTTNGILLEPLAEELARSGLRRVNIGCESVPRFGRIKGGIGAAKDAGLPVKLNLVVMKGINEREIEGMMGLCRESGASLQLIELVETCGNRDFYSKHHLSLQELEEGIARRSVASVTRQLHARRRYLLDGLSVEVVRPMHNTAFCANCTRIRVTSDGRLKPCLMKQDNCVDMLSPIRRGVPDGTLEEIFAGACRSRAPYWGVSRED